MTRSLAFAATVVLLAASVQTGCDQDPARATRLPRAGEMSAARSSSAAAEASADHAGRTLLQWRADMCPPPPEPPGGPSTIVGSGACAFQHHGPASCTLTDDDLLMEASRAMVNDGLFTIYLGVENFRRGGENDNVDIVVSVQNAQGLYRWATDVAHVSVAADLGSVKIAETHLPALPPLREPDVVVSGTFTCAVQAETGPGVR